MPTAESFDTDLAQRVLVALEMEALRGGSRRSTAARVLSTTGRLRPVRTNDVAREYKGGATDKAGREGARHALLALTAAGLAVRLPDGTFLPVGSPLHPVQLASDDPGRAGAQAGER